ncbi:MAG: hypothetical protein AAGB31_14205 [Bdellovibrio sp.]
MAERIKEGVFIMTNKGFVLLFMNVLMAVGVLRSAHAVSPSSVTRNTLRAEKTQEKKWTLPVSIESSSTLHTTDSYERAAQTSISIAPSYALSKLWRLSGTAMVYKEDTGVENSGFDNTSVTLSTVHPLTENISTSYGLSGVLPTNQQLRDETSYQGALRGAASINFANLFLASSFRYGVSYTRNFHEYDMTASSSFNVRENISQTLAYTLPFTDNLSLQTTFVYTYGWTYLGDTRSKFYVGTDLGYAFTKAFSSYVGISNEGNALKPNGSDSNIEFYNDNSSVIKFGLTYTL